MKKILTLIALLFLSGCTAHLVDLSMISNKNINLEKLDIDRAPQRKMIEGEDSAFIFLFIPFGRPKIQEAVNDALQKGNGDLIIDASLYAKQWWFLVGQTSIVIKGTVVDTRGSK